MQQRKTKIYMIFGFVGSGKTTFARRLEEQLPAFRFSPDEWMVALYGTNPPADKFGEYHRKIELFIESQYKRLLELGVDIILDCGFWKRADRNYVRQFAASKGIETVLYWLECPEEEMLKRVLARNDTLESSGSLFIDQNAFELFKSRVEPLGSDEPHVRISSITEA